MSARIRPLPDAGFSEPSQTFQKGFFVVSMREIQLTKGMVAIVDDEDFEELNKLKWCAYKNRNTFYAHKTMNVNGKITTVKMHRKILGLKDGRIKCDHIDGNGLNNQRSNLRICSNAENIRNSKKYSTNSSGFRGVSWSKSSKKWQSQIGHDGKMIPIGRFDDKKEAALAYDIAAKKYHGEFANLNFPNH